MAIVTFGKVNKMNRDVWQVIGASIIGLTVWGIGFWGNRHGAVMGKPIRLPTLLARLMGSTTNDVAGGVLIVQVWGLLCVLLAVILIVLSIDFDTRAAIVLYALTIGGLISFIVAKIYGRKVQ